MPDAKASPLRGKGRGASPSRLPMHATSGAASPPASPPPTKSKPVAASTASNGAASYDSSNIVLSKLPVSPVRPAAAAMRNSSPVRRTTDRSTRGLWQGSAARAPPDLQWSPTIECLIMNSTKQIEAIEQVAQQSVTVALHALPPLRKLSRTAAQDRDRYGNTVRLAMRRAAIADLMEASGPLLADLAYLFGLLAGQSSEAGQHGRTHARRIESLLKDLEGGRDQFAVICKEMKLAGRFLLVRDPALGTHPELEERITEEGQKDTRQLESVLRAVTNSRNKLGAMWHTLAALQAAGVTPDDASWPLLRGLDISTAADVLATLQLEPTASEKVDTAVEAGGEADKEGNPQPQASPGLGRMWWRSASLGRSPRKSPLKGQLNPARQASGKAADAAESDRLAVNGLAHGLADGEAANGNVGEHQLAAENGVHTLPEDHLADMPAIQIRTLKHGNTYRGGILKGVKTGLGQLVYANGDVYEGQFEQDSMHGYGVYAFANGGLYQGQWSSGVYSGLGVETFPTGGTYHGQYYNGSRSGWGACSFANGDYYEGQWAAGAREGRGMQQCPDHSSFIGTYRGGKRHGHGCYTFGNGDRYMGEYADDVPHGHGVYLFASGQAYEGQWRSGSKHGWCVYSLANGQQWAGRWADGRPEWMQSMVAAQAAAKTEGGDKAESMEQALVAAANARKAGNVGAAHFKEHWQPEGPLQGAVRQAVQRAVAAAEVAAGVQDSAKAAVREAMEAAEAAAAAKRKPR